jgi:hypothetical protein
MLTQKQIRELENKIRILQEMENAISTNLNTIRDRHNIPNRYLYRNNVDGYRDKTNRRRMYKGRRYECQDQLDDHYDEVKIREN